MRLFLFFTGLIFFTNTYAQEIELLGTYHAGFLGAESIEFVGKDSFYFKAFYCIEGFLGKGRCEIRDGYLYLYFENDKNWSNAARPAVIIPSKSNDSMSTIQLNLVDKYDKPVSDVTIEVRNSKGKPLHSYYAATGHVRFKIWNDAFPIVLKTSALGFENGAIRLDSSSNYTLTLYNNYFELNHILNKGQIKVYEIGELSEGLILMRPKGEGGPFRQYRKD